MVREKLKVSASLFFTECRSIIFLFPLSRFRTLAVSKVQLVTKNLKNFGNSVERHICDVKNLQLGHDLPISIKDRLISQFWEDFIFMKLRICEVSQK